MKKKRKKQGFVALLLSVCMLSTGNPSYAWAENFSDGEVSADIEEESETEEITTEEVPIDEEETSSEDFTSDETLSTEEEFDTENEFLDGEIDVNTERTGICGNGTKGINIDINSEPYTSFATFNGGENAYKEQGDAWFASARANQLTGKGNEIFNSYDWYNTQAANYGFEIGDIPKAKSLACFYTDNETMHIAVVEAVDGECIVISEGGMPEYSDEEHGYCVIRTISQKELESGYGKGDFLGYVYLDNTDEDQIKKFDDEEEIEIEAESEEQEKVSGQISDIELYTTPSQLGVDEETFQSFEAAALKVRKAFLEGDDICTVTVKTSEHYEEQDIVDKLLKIVYEHTGNPKEGDALYMRREATMYTVSYKLVKKTHQYRISIRQDSFTTIEQEIELDEAVIETLKHLPIDGETKREKITAIYDYVCQNVRYAYGDITEDKLPVTAYGALINKYAVCQGYALLIYRLALEVGIDVRYVRGKAFGENHAWNIVQLDDGLYYNLDATWDEGKKKYQYFLCSEEEFPNHFPNPEYLTAEFKKNYPMYSTGVSADGWEYCENEDGTITLTKTSDILSDIVTVPSIINGKVVSGLGNNLFANNNLITGIVLPVTIKQIEKDVFSECQKLKAIVFEGNAPNIDVNAFGSKISICYPYNDNTWNNDIIKKYGNEVKWMPYEISDIDKNILWILSNTGDLSVYGCGDMPAYSSDNYPSWYMYRKQIISVEVCDGITSILGAFYRCENMKEIDFPESIINIGNQSFARCYSLKNVIIPNKVQNIGSYVFEDCEKLEGIVNIPASVEYIGRGIFEGCSFIEEITVDENNKHYRSIDGGLYNINCTELLAWAGGKEGVARVADTVKVIGASSFSGCTKLTEISLPESIETIENEAFYNCKNIISMKLPDKVKSIDELTFGECSKLEKVYIPNGVTSIGGGAFWACSNIEEIILPENLKSVGNAVFYECTSLKMCNVPEGTEIIGREAFLHCHSLENIYLPETITEIGESAFGTCLSLNEMVIPSKVTQIHYGTFSGCDNLKKIKIKGQIEDIGDYAFSGCFSLIDIKLPSGVKNIGKEAFFQCKNIVSMVMPDNLTTVGENALYGCSNLSYIFFMGDFPDIGNNAFYEVVADCYYPQNSSTWAEDALQSYGGGITWTKWNKYGPSGTNQYWGLCDEGKLFLFGNGEMYDFSSDKLPWTDWSLDIEEVLFAVDINNISNNAFTGCSNLNKITFLGETPQIAENAFDGITAEAYYPVSDTWTEEKLQNYGGILSWNRAAIAEGICGEGVKWLFYPTGILYIYGNGKMSDYTSELDIPWSKYRLKIKKVVIENGVSNVGAHAFERCSTKNVVLPNSIREIGENAFTCYEGDELTIPEGVKIIGYQAFLGSHLTKITIPSSVEKMGNNAFQMCQLLKTAGPIGGGYNIEYGWKDEIPGGAFYGTAYLKELVISDSITSIGNLFNHDLCTIEKILVDKDNKNFSSDEFGVLFNKEKTELLKVPFGLVNEIYSIPDSVTSIKSYAVQCCYNLKKIIIPDSVMTIPYGAFMYCENVESVTIGKRCDFFDVSAFPALKEIRISEDNPYYSCDVGRVLYNKNRSEILKMLKNYEGEYEVPDTVTTIAAYAFEDCDEISAINIPDSVTKIEYGAFRNCIGLNSVIFKGEAPIIQVGVFKGVTATVQYPQESSSWTDDMLQEYGGTITWKPYHACNYTFEIQNEVFATCTQNGYTGDKYCKICGNKESGEEIPATGHSEEVDEGKAPTCTENGLTEGKHCSICGEVLEVQEEIPATGHSEEVLEGKAPTCTETGLTEGKHCNVCGEVLEAQEEIPPTGHTEEIDEGKAPICTESGLTEGKHCSVCGEVLETQEKIPATGHSEEVQEGKAPTCTESGLTEGKHCSVCGEVLETQEKIPATGHSEEVQEGKAPTCTESGLTEGKHCSVCGEVLEAQEEIPATGHVVEVDEGKAATCTESGLTEGKHCSVCGEVLETQKEIPATGHTDGEWTITKEATAVSEGQQELRCTVCGNVIQTKKIAKLKATIKLNVPNTLPLKVKQTFQIQVSGIAKGDKVSSWKSNNTKIATVTSSGKITGKKSGTATVTVKLRSGLTSQVKVKVQKTDVAATSITVLNKATNKKITGTTTLKVRKKLTLAVTLAPVTCKQKVTYTSSNKKVAAVSSKGVITALKKGTATITVKADKKTAKIKIKVN